MSSALALLTVSFAITVTVTPLVIRLAKRYQLVDDKRRKHPARIHKGTIPRAGGLAIYIGIIIPIIFMIGLSKPLWGIILGLTVLLVVGLGDDIKDINPYLRFLTNILASLFVVASGINVIYINNPLTGQPLHLDSWRINFEFFGEHSFLPLANLFAILWIVWTMNIVGWSAGVDGQLPGFVAIASLVLGALSLRFLPQDPSQLVVIKLAMVTAGSYLGFLLWNFYPQKIMPGYSGKTIAGFMIAIMAIWAQAKVGTAILVLGVPMVDALYTLIRRLLQKRSPVWPDRGHLHHQLLDLGWGKRRIAVFYWLITLLLGLVALTVTAQAKFFTVLLLIAWIGFVIAWANIFKMIKGIKK